MKIVLIPPLLCSPLAYAPVLDTVWARGQVTLADTRHDDAIAAMAERILRENAGDIAVLGTSMGGYVALEVIRQAPDRVTALALVSTSARADTTEQTRARARQSALVEAGHFDALVDAAFPGVVAADNESDGALLATWRSMTSPVGAAAFLRQQQAVVQRADLRSMLPSIACPTAVIHGAQDRLIPLDAAEEIAAALPRPSSPSSRVPATSCSTSSPKPDATPSTPGSSPPHSQQPARVGTASARAPIRQRLHGEACLSR